MCVCVRKVCSRSVQHQKIGSPLHSWLRDIHIVHKAHNLTHAKKMATTFEEAAVQSQITKINSQTYLRWKHDLTRTHSSVRPTYTSTIV